jgi:hypothetical protein
VWRPGRNSNRKRLTFCRGGVQRSRIGSLLPLALLVGAWWVAKGAALVLLPCGSVWLYVALMIEALVFIGESRGSMDCGDCGLQVWCRLGLWGY